MPTQKALYVREMFAAIAPRYDVANRVMTAGADEGWRRRAVRELAAPHGGQVVDLCCGTGDLAFHLARSDRSLHVTGIDFCEPMLDAARARSPREGAGSRVLFEVADAMALPFEDAAFDGATMGFSMRNVVEIGATLREIRRVLKPGARFVNLDVSHAPSRLMRSLFAVYFYHVVPWLGGLVGGSRSAYRYLPSSLTNFPDADRLAGHFEAAGFSAVRYFRLAAGTVALHVGTA